MTHPEHTCPVIQTTEENLQLRFSLSNNCPYLFPPHTSRISSYMLKTRFESDKRVDGVAVDSFLGPTLADVFLVMTER